MSCRSNPVSRRLVVGRVGLGWRTCVASFISLLVLASCATPNRTGSGEDSSPDSTLTAGFVSLPAGWSVVSQQSTEQLYQAQVEGPDREARVLLGRLPFDAAGVGDTSAYLESLHATIVARIKGQSGAQPFIEEPVVWSNDARGLRTLLRGTLGEHPVIIEGLTFIQGEDVYFAYARFPESEYQGRKPEFDAILASAKPLEGARLLDEAELLAAQEPPAKEPERVRELDPVAGPPEIEVFSTPARSIGAFTWGSPRASFLEKLGAPARESEQMLAYPIKFEGYLSTIVFLFTLDSFSRSVVQFEETYADASGYFDEYMLVDQRLAQTYGQPVQRAAIWSNPELKSEQTKWPLALVRGDVVFGTVWQIDGVKVIHSLKSDGLGRATHRLIFKLAASGSG